MKLLRTGKVKQVFDAADGTLLFKFTNNVSVFDKIIPTDVPKKGEVLNRTAEYWFKEAEARGYRTHFLERPAPDEMRVKKVDVIADYDKITPDARRLLIPLEVICRHYLAGSMHDRVKRGNVKPEELGFPAGEVPAYGAKLPEPFVEFTTKVEKFDRELTEAEAQRISRLSDDEFQALKDAVIDLDRMIQERVAERGLIHVDGKKEFAFNENRELMIVDTFGTPDEDRWWDADAYARGEIRELSKEFVRQHYRATGYHDRLTAAREAGESEPDIPALPEDVTRQVTDLYVSQFERITGLPF